MQKNLIVIIGPTGVGKTDLSLDIAEAFQTEIISSDSRQIYKELTIGTAVPTKEDLQRVKHHFIQTISVKDYFSASLFENKVLEKLSELFKEHDSVVMTGGSMLYIDAVCNGIDDLPTIDPEIRNELLDRFEKEGLESLRIELKRVDPEYYETADIKNPKRILHALEIFYMTGKKFSSLRTNTRKQRDFNIVKVGLNRDREELYDRINRRVDIMLDEGLIAEARTVYPYKELNSLNTVGYKELFQYFDGDIPEEEAIRLIKRNSRRYARKQLSWFRRDKELQWFHPDDVDAVKEYISTSIKK
ncbi:tRNA (adenosine(37)-N6)-dimethylallyltransferase MiaA [Puteibacter caeruleilacunae]|nr:tRNA (adenosine(37)-N6)-dimethylallyltransferase MiaA [Puteibacter caeruleilacunae]